MRTLLSQKTLGTGVRVPRHPMIVAAATPPATALAVCKN
jgi:hypothetical protein